LRELRASARRACDQGRARASVHLLVLSRTAARSQTAEQAKRRTELERLTLALAAHDPQRTIARGYVLVEDRAGDPLPTAAAALEAEDLRLRFRDGIVPARVTQKDPTE
jgi:exodeoxyribonuclease VII large subunit